MSRKRKSDAPSEDEPEAKSSRTQEKGLVDLPDAILSLVCAWTSQDIEVHNRRIRTAHRLRLVCRRMDRWFRRLSFDPAVFRLALFALKSEHVLPWSSCPFKIHVDHLILLLESCQPTELEIYREFPNVQILASSNNFPEKIVAMLPNLRHLILNRAVCLYKDFPVKAPFLTHLTLPRVQDAWNFSVLHNAFPHLQELTIGSVSLPDGAMTPLILPKRLRHLCVPLWLLLLSKAEPGTVIEQLSLTSSEMGRFDMAEVKAKQPFPDDNQIKETMRNVTVNTFVVDPYWFGFASFPWLFEWGIQFSGTLSVRCPLSMDRSFKQMLRTIWWSDTSVVINRFECLEIHTHGSSSLIAKQVHGSVFAPNPAREMRVPPSTTIKIFSPDSLRGACTLLYRPEFKMFDLQWEERPSRSSMTYLV
jgi:hypothetical protein